MSMATYEDDKSKFLKVYDWLHATNERTWMGHWASAMVLFWMGYAAGGIIGGFIAAAAAFGYREFGDLAGAIADLGLKAAIRKKMLDGIMDYTMPIMSAGTQILLLTGGPGTAVAGVAASAFTIFVAGKVKPRD